MELKLEQVEKLQNDIEVLMKKYTDDTGVIKDWKVQSIAGSIVKNLIIPLVSKPKGTFVPGDVKLPKSQDL